MSSSKREADLGDIIPHGGALATTNNCPKRTPPLQVRKNSPLNIPSSSISAIVPQTCHSAGECGHQQDPGHPSIWRKLVGEVEGLPPLLASFASPVH
jgi:hypothetical protein